MEAKGPRVEERIFCITIDYIEKLLVKKLFFFSNSTTSSSTTNISNLMKSPMMSFTSSRQWWRSLTQDFQNIYVSRTQLYNEHRKVWRILLEQWVERHWSGGTASPTQITFRSVGSGHHLLSAWRITNHSWWHVLYFEYLTLLDRHQKSICQALHTLNIHM